MSAFGYPLISSVRRCSSQSLDTRTSGHRERPCCSQYHPVVTGMRRSRAKMCGLLLLFLASACRGDLVSGNDPHPLETTTWILDHIDLSGKVSEPAVNETYSIILEGSIVAGRADCNDCSGSYHFQSNDALVLSLGCTESACGPSGASFPHFPVYASGVFDHEIDESTLTLRKHQSEGSLNLVFLAGE